MKINAQEQLLMNKNMNLISAKGLTNTIAAEPPVAAPETKMSALDAMAQSNISFQAGLKGMETIKKLPKVLAMAAMLAGGTLATSTMMTSCIEQHVTVEVDMSAITALFQQMMDINQQLLEQQKINSQQLAEMNAWLKQLYQAVLNGQMTAEEFYRQVYEYMTLDSINQQIIIDQLVANGKTQEEALAYLQQLIADVESGKITYEEAVAQIMAILNSIDATLKDILTVVQGIRDDMNANHKEYMDSKQEELTYLSNIYNQGQINGAYLEQLVAASDSANAQLSRLVSNTDELLAIAKDETKFNELMAQIADLKLGDEEYQKFEEMFKLLNMNLQDALTMNQKEIVNAIKQFQDTYLYVEGVETGLMMEISNKLTFIANYMENVDQTAIIDAINALKGSVDNNTDAIENVNNKLDALLAKMDNLIDNTADLQGYFDAQQANWDKVIGLLDKADSTLLEIRDAQAVTNQYLADFTNDFADMKAAQQLTNSYLNILNQKADDIKEAIQEIDATGGAGMTREEFLSAMYERDSVNAVKFEQFLADYGFDQVPGNVQTIKDLLGQIDNKVADQSNYADQLNRIIALENDIYALLQNIDFNNAEQVAKLNRLIEILSNFNCNCNTDESITDLENMFS